MAQEDASDTRGLPMKMDLRNANIRDVLTDIYKDRGSFVMDPKVHGKVSGHFEGEQLNAVDDILRMVRATIRVERGVSLIISTELLREEWTTKQASDRTVVLSFQNCELANALGAIMSVANDGHATSLDIRASGVVNCSGRYASFDDAVRAVVDSTNNVLRISDGAYTVETPVDLWNDKLTYDFKATDIRDALRALFRNINVNYSIAPEVQGTVNGHFEGNFLEVFTLILWHMNSTFRVQGQVFEIVKMEPLLVNAPLKLFSTTTLVPTFKKWLPPDLDKIVMPRHLVFKDINVQDVLATVFAKVPKAGSYRIDPLLIKRISVDLSDKSLENALGAIAIASGALVSFENGVFIYKKNPYLDPGR